MYDRDSAIILIEYREGNEVYRVKSEIDASILFTDRSHVAVGMAAENMWRKLEKDLFDRA